MTDDCGLCGERDDNPRHTVYGADGIACHCHVDPRVCITVLNKELSRQDERRLNAEWRAMQLGDEIQRIKREMYQEALDDMRQLAAPLFAKLEQRKDGE